MSNEFEETGLQALLANSYGIFPDRSVLEFSRFYAFGSGLEFALGAMYRAYACGESAETTARARIEATAEFDDHTALPLEVRTVLLAGEPCAVRRARWFGGANGKETK